MPQYAAILGHQPHISIAELAATVPGFSLECIESKQVAVFESAQELDAGLIDQLGGTSLLAERITEADVEMDDIPQLLTQEVKHVKKKVTFGLRCFSVPRPAIKTAYRRGKEAIKAKGNPCRYVGNERKPAATAVLLDTEITSGKKGVELFIIGREDGLWVGRTIGVQDIDSYTWRDMEKPVRDTSVGLLPPKLAQVMLNFGAWLAQQNLSEKQKKKNAERKRKKRQVYTVLDPFCGTGVIPLECLLRGWHVLASDSAQKAVNGCKKNIEWLRKEKKILKKDVSDTVAKHDATKAFSFKELPDIVVTETTLGPGIEKSITKRDATKYKKENESLQAAFLKNAAQTLPGVPIVCCFPYWNVKGEEVHLEKIWNVIEELGYKTVNPHGEDGKKVLPYKRKDQFVGRDIVLLMPPTQE